MTTWEAIEHLPNLYRKVAVYPFKNRQALRAHLGHCPKRDLVRSFKVQDVIFELTLNPKRRHLKALHRTAEEFNDRARYPDGVRLFSAVVFHLQRAGIVKSYKVIRPESPVVT